MTQEIIPVASWFLTGICLGALIALRSAKAKSKAVANKAYYQGWDDHKMAMQSIDRYRRDDLGRFAPKPRKGDSK
jgi:hypothetical protein